MKTIHIMTATLTAGDAIGNYSRILQRIFWRAGFRVKLYADLWDKYSLCLHSREFLPQAQEGDILWYHYSIYSDNISILPRTNLFTILDYHGVTPPSLFTGYSSHLENLCRLGEEWITELSPHVDLAIAHSDYTLQELRKYGFGEVMKIPLVVETASFAVPEPHNLANLLQTVKYLLFVGRITPQKSIIELLEVFAYLIGHYPDFYLILVGEYSYSPQYVAEIRQKITSLGLDDRVILTGKVAHKEALKSLFTHALFAVYLSFWETFCVPLIESMYLKTPVIGLNRTAIPEVLGPGGILLEDHDPEAFYKAVSPYLEDKNRYRTLSDTAYQHAQNFTEKTLTENITRKIIPGITKSVSPPKIALVVQRYGLEVYGGAEYLCRLMAEHLSKYLPIEVITTCAQDYHSWQNYYPPGTEQLNGITVHRFEVQKTRHMETWAQYTRDLFDQGVEKISFAQAMAWMRQQGPRARDLLSFIQNKQQEYDFFIFFTYLYSSTVFGLPLVRNKAVLVPTAHNEPPIYLKIFRDLFRLPRGIVYLTETEKDFVLRLYQNHFIPAIVSGVGIDEPQDVDAARFQAKYGLSNPFFLYIGRVAGSKGCQELFDAFFEYKKQHPNPLKLVLIGQTMMEIPDHPDIKALGFLPDQDKYDALQAAQVLINPSPFESLSFSVLESWLQETPTLVNARCDVLADHTHLSGGGSTFITPQDFISQLNLFTNDPQKASEMGKSGRKYVQTYYTWEQVEGTLLNFLSELHNPTFNRNASQ
ncbi:glycosyltransferase family 4 protein [candidate division CSSED10-310 bacterium]|uniref:Glycosyltransferase family 4 protein n=1 Tax=candidate division CSSED10-310 bacterium TaxID=2855610 RepID=A0ABV6YVR5_UNCC1